MTPTRSPGLTPCSRRSPATLALASSSSRYVIAASSTRTATRSACERVVLARFDARFVTILSPSTRDRRRAPEIFIVGRADQAVVGLAYQACSLSLVSRHNLVPSFPAGTPIPPDGAFGWQKGNVPVLRERADAGDGAAHDERLHGLGALEGVNGLQVHHVPHDLVVEQDTVAAEHVTRVGGYRAGLAGVVHLGQPGHGGGQPACLGQTADLQAVELHRGEVRQHG